MGAPPMGWYPDPWRVAPLRWWDGWQWTPHTSAPSAPPVVPAPPVEAAPLDEPAPTFAFAAAGWALAGIAASIVAAELLSDLLVRHLVMPAALTVAVFYVVLYGGIASTCLAVSRRFGSGNLVVDFGWRARVTDLWRGLLVGVATIGVSIVTNIPWVNDQRIAHTDRALGDAYAHLPWLALVELGIAAVVLAPLIEELAFRGVLLRALSERLGVEWAVLLQAMLFGLYHYAPTLGRANEPGVVVRAAAGLVLGLAATRWRRLGPGIVAHCALNLLVVVVFVLSH